MSSPAVAQEKIDQEILENRRPSIAHVFRDRVLTSGNQVAYKYFREDTLVDITWAETKDLVWSWAAGLLALNAQIGDRVAIASTTRFEWIVADLAVMCAGCATTTVYPTTNAGDVAYLLADSGSRIVFAEDAGQVAKLRGRRNEIPSVSKVICFEDEPLVDNDDGWVITLAELSEMGDEFLRRSPTAVDERIDALTSRHLATIIYTSGTTGPPKGAELPHDAFVWAGASIASINLMTEDDLQYLWLPLSHVFGKILLSIPLQVGFPTAVDGRLDKIVDNLAVVKPTWMGAAPRIFEKVKAKVGMTFDEATGVKALLIKWALGIGQQVAVHRQAGRKLPPHLLLQYIAADALVLRKVRERFGGRIRFFISGSAPLDPEVGWWFAAFGLLICEGYGLTETAALTTVNRPHTGTFRFGSIGWPAPGTDVKIAPDGEVLVKGPGVMLGYHNKPEATEEVFTEDGYFCTGDIGEIDERGFITITDRKKDLFKTSGGKYIAPAQIEAHFKGLCPYVSQFLVIGAGKPFASALVTLDEESITGWAAKNGMTGQPYEQIVTSSAARDLVQEYIDQLNANLNRWETIKQFSILERDLSIEHEELTPSMKLRRRAVLEHFPEHVERLYDESHRPK
ncbi:AMP-dependent synthetase/ligase [Austwickia chelonae]|uniref:AMP-dependent synthetase/ligase n=1 Tax=Austwickia chelonae TaxID=100225 RepID=UPI000E264F09|nr:long-chain fatty acid--CoA ligase [Austwickia chelonae]